jgi:hypothetical protein
MGLRAGSKPSDACLIFGLKAKKPHVYRDFAGAGIVAPAGGEIQVVIGEPRNPVEDRIKAATGNGKKNGKGKG